MGAAIATVTAYADFRAVLANAFSVKTRLLFFMQMRSFFPTKS